MLLLAVVALGVVGVVATGGHPSQLGCVRFRRTGALAAAGAVQVVITTWTHGPPHLHEALHLLSYACAAYFVVANARVPGVLLVGSGGLLNAAAIAANGGVMPAAPGAVATAGIPDAAGGFANSQAVDGANLWFLGDVFAVPETWPLANVFSVGDVVIAVAVVYALHRLCRRPLVPRPTTEGMVAAAR